MNDIIMLDGVSLQDVVSGVDLQVLDVIELAPERTTNLQELLISPGSVISRDHITCRKIRVQFVLLTSDDVRRTAVLSDVAAWAMQGRILQLHDRPGQQLHVVCTESPFTQSKRKWTDPCEMTFTAVRPPFWEDVLPSQRAASAVTTATLFLHPRGNVHNAPLMCTITPLEQPLTTLTLACAGRQMTFSGLDVPAGRPFSVDYKDGFLTASWLAEDGTVIPCLSKRTGDSHILLTARRDNEVAVTADVPCDIQTSVRGWYW